MLEEVRRAYSELEVYEDLGELRSWVGGAESVPPRVFWFATRVAPGGFRWDVWRSGDQATTQQVLWREGARAYVYESHRQQFKPVPSLVSEIVHGFGDGAYEALAVPVFFAGSVDVFADPEAAAVDGPESFGGASCWLLTFSRMRDSISSTWWVDQETSMILRIEVELEPPAVERTTRIVVEHQVLPVLAMPSADELLFEPPAGTVEVAEWTSPQEARDRDAPAGDATGTFSGIPDDLPDVGFFDEITVASFTVTARIVDRGGRPIPGLVPEDLVAWAGSRRTAASELRISGLEWVGERHPMPSGRSATREPGGQRIVIYLQTDFEPAVARGQLKFLPYLESLVRSLPPDGEVAVVSFYRHLELWQDFSRDRDATVRILKEAVRPAGRPLLREGELGALARSFDFEGARRATTPETGLRIVGEALGTLRGEKAVLYVGWFVGELRFGEGVSMGEDYGPALDALDAARASVFVLDVTEADRHDLEGGLMLIARDTGGTYAKTHRFPAQAIQRLAETLTGYYLVTLERDDTSPVGGRLRLALRDGAGEVVIKPLVLAGRSRGS